MKTLKLLSMTVLLGTSVLAQDIPVEVTGTTDSWLRDGAATIKDRVASTPNTNRAKNVILFIGDGMGISTLTAGRILEGQLEGKPGEENYLSFERFPYTALVKTYNVDAQVPDSAGTASAMNTGVKTRVGVINTSPTHPHGQCEGMKDNLITPLSNYAEKVGMSTGIVSTARLTHATPAAVFAHAASRGWESDNNLPDEAKENGCRDIAQQILDPIGGDGLEVALGGGKRAFLPVDQDGRREDGRNIIEEWKNSRAGAAYVDNASDLAAIDPEKTSRLLGFFGNSHQSYEADRTEEMPDLAAQTAAAIKMLQKDDDGYYLMVEAGRIDHAHHGGNAYRALHDTVALSKAVKTALEMVNTEETLILVTADHSHVFTMAGYQSRGNPILGLVRRGDELANAKDGKPYTTLGYQNGPGAITDQERPVLTDEDVHAPNFQQQSLVHLDSETHGGEDVGLFAIGPWAHLARGTIEQNVIFHLIDHALSLRERASEQ